MVELQYFILGILFVSVVSPVLDLLVALLASGLEVLKGYCTVKITKMNAQIQKIAVEDEGPRHVIGFQVPSSNYDEEEEDEEE